MMPSSRTSPALRPVSPLSPGYKPSHFDSLQPPSPRSMQSRNSAKQRRPPTNSLKLPSLPRFHPANFPSQNNSLQPTPDGQSPNQPPMSPRTHQRMYSEVQRQLYFNQRELFHARESSPSNYGAKPTSPRLVPAGSPGPVTPLELEGEDGYLLAGARHELNGNASSQELVDELIREEAQRRRDKSGDRVRC